MKKRIKKFFAWMVKLFTRQKSVQELVNEYFTLHPEAKDGVLKAFYAWHDENSSYEKSHIFDGTYRQAKCILCGRTREQVRHDNLPGGCSVGAVSVMNDSEMTHRFGGSAPWAHCVYCDKTREELSDSIQPIPGGYGYKRCSAYAKVDIAKVILDEENKAHALIASAEQKLPALLKKKPVSGHTLFVLHGTHGFPPEIVENFATVPPEAKQEYEILMEQDREKSRKAMVKKVVTAKQV